ncbi:MAG: hypothetical protein AB1391_04115 [Candidatus Micrarchaeota archaeon]
MDFDELADEVREIEKKASKKKSWSGTIELPKTIDFSPKEFVDMTYSDILNSYDRMEKIATMSGVQLKSISQKIPLSQPPIQLRSSSLPFSILPPSLPQPSSQSPSSQSISSQLSPPPSHPLQPQSSVQLEKKEEKESIKEKIKETDLQTETTKQTETKPDIFTFESNFSVRKEAAHEEQTKKSDVETRIAELVSSSKQTEIKEESSEKHVEKHDKIEAIKQDKSEIKPEVTQKKLVEGPIFEFERDFEIDKKYDEKPEKVIESKEMKEVQENIEKPVSKEIFSQETKEIMSEVSENSEIPYIAKHEPISLIIPSLLSSSPEQVAERVYNEIESTIPREPEKENLFEIKKRMIELTKQLFAEKSTAERRKITEEIAKLRRLFSMKEETPKIKVSYPTLLFNSTEIAQNTELSVAKESLIKEYHEQLSKILGAFSSSLKIAANNMEKRKVIYDILVSDLDNLKVQCETLSDKYELFFLKEHEIILQKLCNVALFKNDNYVVKKIDGRIEEIKFSYQKGFLSLKNTIRKEISSLIQSKKHEALEASRDEEMEKVLSIINMKEEELLKYIHANNQEKYKEFENGKITKLELLIASRMLMALELGLKKEVIDKYFEHL